MQLPRFVLLALLVTSTIGAPRLSAQTATAPASNGEARVSVQGVIVLVDPVLGPFVQTSEAVVALQPSPGMTLAAGDRIEAQGILVEANGRRTLTGATILRQTAGTLPPPRRTTVTLLANEPGDWVEFDTVVQEVARPAGSLELRVPSDLWPVVVAAPPAAVDPDDLVDARVRIRGVRQIDRNPQGGVIGVRVLTSAIVAEQVLERAPAAAFELPIATAAEIRRVTIEQSTDRRLRMRGIVLMKHPAFVPGRRVVHVLDSTGAIVADVLDDAGVVAGDRVDVVGFPGLFFGTPVMVSAVVRREGPGELPAAAPATARELLSGRVKGAFVSLQATFTAASVAQGANMLSLDSDGTTITAYLFDWPAHGPLPDLTPGTIVDVTGVQQVINGPGGDAQVIITLAGPESIHIVQRPPWWTPARKTSAVLAGAGLLVLALTWVWVLNLRVRAQTRAFEEQYRRAAALQRRWTDLVTTASDVILTWDLEGRLLSMNKAGEALTGLTEDDARGRMFEGLATPESAEAAAALLRQGTADPVTATGVVELAGPDGHAVPLEMSVQRMFEEEVHIGYLAIGRNVAAQKRVERALRAARDAAEDANRAKSEFLANMSHEIRTPMNGIIGMTELTLTTDLSDIQREYLQTVKMSGESLLGLLNSILDFSKIESRKLELESVPFALRDVIAETLKPLAFKTDEKGLELLCDIDPDVPDALIGDPLRIRQIVTNLISNAIKFTDRGHVLLAIREDRRAENCTRLHFSVTDTGLGIAEDKHATIFEPFSQADGSTTRRFGGTGLGLAISATLVRLMGGRIWVESAPGAGSTFYFTAGFDVTSAVEPAAVEPLLANLPVLVVDDNAINRRIFSEQLSRWGMRATLADGGLAAIAALDAAATRGEPFLLVLLDANMPELDGFAVAEHIHSRPALAGATIMMLTSSGHFGDADRCRALNIAAYLTKPIAPNHLFEAICRVIGGRKKLTAPVAQQPPKPIAAAALASPRRVLLAEDNVVNQRVAIGLLSKRGHHVTLATNGREALDALEQASFDIVLMDVQMPEIGGLEATEEIRRREAGTGRHVRIVAMTAHAMNGDRDQCLSAGMDGYLSKPVDPVMLYAVVEQETARAAVPRAADDRTAVSSLDPRELRDRLNGDEELFSEVIQAFLEDCPLRLAAIRSAIDKHDVEELRRAAHALKGAAGNLAAGPLFTMAHTLEQLASDGRADAWEAAWRQLSAEAAHVLDLLRRFEPTRPTVDSSASAR